VDEVERSVRLADAGTFQRAEDALQTEDPLDFPGYRDASKAVASEWDESVIAGPAEIAGNKVELALFDFSFFGGSMGEVAGERLARGLERAARRRVPFVLRVATGGARMQEGMAALVQMPKVVAARMILARAHTPFIVVLANPSTGGVLASVAALADLTIAESKATVGFAGPRVVEAFTGKKPGRKSHHAESALAAGLVDHVVGAEEAHIAIARFLDVLQPNGSALLPTPSPAKGGGRIEAWDAVRAARDPARPRARKLVDGLAQGRGIELKGDRQGTDDPALVAAVVRVHERKMLVLALDHEHSPGPGAYRKARRALEVAARLMLPVATVVDTRGADPSPDSENAGIAWEIARLFEDLLAAPVPVISVVTGEGGSGGALAFAVGDRLLIYRDATFSVIGPEAAAQILWRDPSRAPEAARLQRLTAHDLQDLGIADEVVESPLTSEGLASVLAYHLARLEEERAAGRNWALDRQTRWRNPRD
jgi:acetyl-CoA carboxylase carboxyl transferase subunit beta